MPLHAAHILRKYDPSEWGGTETAVLHLYEGLQLNGVESTIFCPAIDKKQISDPFRDRGWKVKYYHALIPAWGISKERKAQLIRLGGNIVSWDLPGKLLFEKDLQVIHSHAVNRLAGNRNAGGAIETNTLCHHHSRRCLRYIS